MASRATRSSDLQRIVLPDGVLAAVLSVNVIAPEPVRDGGLEICVAPEGSPCTLKLTVPAKPFVGVKLTV